MIGSRSQFASKLARKIRTEDVDQNILSNEYGIENWAPGQKHLKWKL